MANGNDDKEEREYKTPDGGSMVIRVPKNTSDDLAKQYVQSEYFKTHPAPAVISASPAAADITDELTQADPEEFLRAMPRGAVRGFMATPSLMLQAGQAETDVMSQIGTPGRTPGVKAPTVEEMTEPAAGAISSASRGYIPMEKPTTPSGEAGERVGEFLGDIPSWIGPGGKIIKALTAIGGGIGSFVGEKIGGAPGAFVGGAIGGGLTGAASIEGLPRRLPRAVREATSEQAVKRASKTAYGEMAALDYTMDPLAAGRIRDAIKKHLIEYEPTEPSRQVFDPKQMEGVLGIVNDMTTPRARRNAISLHDIERTRQLLNNERLNGGSNAVAASEAIEIIDVLMLELPGVKEITTAARGNWAAYKRGQIIEETLRRAVDRAGTSGTGGNIDNAVRQEFLRRIRNNPTVWRNFEKSPREAHEVEKILNPGYALNIARALSRLSPYRHTLIGGGAGAATWHFTHDPFWALLQFGVGEAAHKTAEHLQIGRAERLAEMTRARSPAGEAAGYRGPPPVIKRPARAGLGAARALGATALSPEAAEAIELPEIKVTPQ